VFAFDANGHELSRKIYQGNSVGASPALLSTVNTVWAANGTPAAVTTILEDGSTQSETDSAYDSNGVLQNISFYDFGNGLRGPLLKTLSYSYLASSDGNYAAPRNMINLISEIQVNDLPETIWEGAPAAPGSLSYHAALREAKEKIVTQALESAGGNYTEAARRLGVHVTYLHRLMKAFKSGEREI